MDQRTAVNVKTDQLLRITDEKTECIGELEER